MFATCNGLPLTINMSSRRGILVFPTPLAIQLVSLSLPPYTVSPILLLQPTLAPRTSQSASTARTSTRPLATSLPFIPIARPSMPLAMTEMMGTAMKAMRRRKMAMAMGRTRRKIQKRMKKRDRGGGSSRTVARALLVIRLLTCQHFCR